MSAATYAVWVLILQTAAYTGYLDFGLQSAIGRYYAYAKERADVELRDAVFSTALSGLFVAAALSILGLVVVSFWIPSIFPSVPATLIPSMRLSLLIVGFSMAANMPASACNGIFVGMERYEIPAITVGGARLISSAGILIAALNHASLVTMAVIVASTNLVSYIAQYATLKRIAPDIAFRPEVISRATARELTNYCFGLTVMAFSGLLVSGLDLILVGRFEFAVVTPYSVAVSMITLIAGLLYAVINVLIPHAARLHAREDSVSLGDLVISSTQASLLLLLLTGLPILIFARPIIALWIGTRYEAVGAPILMALVLANIVRLAGAPYALVLVAAAQQSYIKISPLSEGFSNLIASLVLGVLCGGFGVALGTLVGAFVSIASHLWYSMPRTSVAIQLSRSKFLKDSVVAPVLWTSPLSLCAILTALGRHLSIGIVGSSFVASLLGAVWLFYRTGMFARVFSENLRTAIQPVSPHG